MSTTYEDRLASVHGDEVIVRVEDGELKLSIRNVAWGRTITAVLSPEVVSDVSESLTAALAQKESEK